MITITLPSADHLDFMKAALKLVQVPWQHVRVAVEVAEALENPDTPAIPGYEKDE
ncbi:hypothetical protein CP98_03647 [Sphingobium yanoikuyae]|uniref:Uncharacterized protein n=1 Tax=Sphingobium yanoikuyae TaxID=13690 RepID=A0A084EGQ7_SPHYA|nr:hypothetical protein [Sphingobium yanoikuyae]KEZ17149.1 hypothetical protein CP98_03647 [Sphingobium yanoikuyae]